MRPCSPAHGHLKLRLKPGEEIEKGAGWVERRWGGSMGGGWSAEVRGIGERRGG